MRHSTNLLIGCALIVIASIVGAMGNATKAVVGGRPYEFGKICPLPR